VGVARRERKIKSLKGNKKVTKIDASYLKNLGTELDQPNVGTLLLGKSLFISSK
jgi:hypothetical protein